MPQQKLNWRDNDILENKLFKIWALDNLTDLN